MSSLGTVWPPRLFYHLTVSQPAVSRAPAVDPGVGVGGILVAFAPGYGERLVDRVADDAVGSFIYGLVVLVALVVLVVLLVISIFGIVLAIPLAIVAGIVWAVGAAVAFLAIGERLVGSDDGWLKPLVVGALINGGLTLTGIGGLVSFAVGAAGFGALVCDWQE